MSRGSHITGWKLYMNKHWTILVAVGILLPWIAVCIFFLNSALKMVLEAEKGNEYTSRGEERIIPSLSRLSASIYEQKDGKGRYSRIFSKETKALYHAKLFWALQKRRLEEGERSGGMERVRERARALPLENAQGDHAGAQNPLYPRNRRSLKEKSASCVVQHVQWESVWNRWSHPGIQRKSSDSSLWESEYDGKFGLFMRKNH